MIHVETHVHRSGDRRRSWEPQTFHIMKDDFKGKESYGFILLFLPVSESDVEVDALNKSHGVGFKSGATSAGLAFWLEVAGCELESN